MGKQRREDKRNKRIKERVWTPRAVYHRTHRTCRGPGSYADGSRVAGVPVLIETGHYRERQCRDQAKLDERPHQIAETVDYRRRRDELDVAREGDRVDHGQKTKQPETLATPPRIDLKVFAVSVKSPAHSRLQTRYRAVTRLLTLSY
jgi:hypothetical protein